jgi:cobalt/nickel transport system ATP-binding protein
MDPELLESKNLEIPEITRLFRLLRYFGYDPENLPLSVDQAVAELTRTMREGDGHVHLHLHRHVHAGPLEKKPEPDGKGHGHEHMV